MSCLLLGVLLLVQLLLDHQVEYDAALHADPLRLAALRYNRKGVGLRAYLGGAVRRLLVLGHVERVQLQFLLFRLKLVLLQLLQPLVQLVQLLNRILNA